MKSSHFSDTTCIIRNRAISVNGEGNREASKHSEGRKGDSVHSTEDEGSIDSEGNAENRNDAREVSKGKTKNNVGSSTHAAGFSEILDGRIGIACVDLSHITNDKTGPQAKVNTAKCLPLGAFNVRSSEHIIEVETLREDENDGNGKDGHQESGDNQLNLDSSLNVFLGDSANVGG